MLPTQILLNNVLYDISEVPIPLDQVDPEELRQPRVLDMKFIRDFMLVIGPISSAFDFLTFYVMLTVLQADEKLFQTGWFVESLCTQVLVIFIIRTRGNPFKSRPQSGSVGDLVHRCRARRSAAVYAVGDVLRLRSAAGAFLSHPGGHGGCLPDCGRTHQEGLLPVAQRSSLDGRRWRRGALKLMVRRLANSARWHRGDRPA